MNEEEQFRQQFRLDCVRQAICAGVPAHGVIEFAAKLAEFISGRPEKRRRKSSAKAARRSH